MELDPIVIAVFFTTCGFNLLLVPILMLNAVKYRKALKVYQSVVSTEQRITVADILNKDDDES